LLERPDEAADFHRLAVTGFRETDDRWSLATALVNLGEVTHPPEDETHLRGALDLLTAFEDPAAARLREHLRTRLG
jgi:hypothetical protein